jgi:hypothetical protein
MIRRFNYDYGVEIEWKEGKLNIKKASEEIYHMIESKDLFIFL